MDKSSTINTDHTTSAWDENALNAAQLGGRACVVCGTENGPMKPVSLHIGPSGSNQLFACSGDNRPSWQTAPCPSWCVERHHNHDMPDDRLHWSDWHGVDLTSMDMENIGPKDQPDYRTHNASAVLFQHYREAEPRVSLIDDIHDRCAYSMHMTLDEAEQLAFHLFELVRQGRGSWRPMVLPFDHEGRCGDPSCIACRPAAEVTA